MSSKCELAHNRACSFRARASVPHPTRRHLMGGLKILIAEAAAHFCTTTARNDFPHAISNDTAA